MARPRLRRRAGALAALGAALLLAAAPTVATAATPSPKGSASPSVSPTPSLPPDPNAIGGPRMGEHGLVLGKAAGVPAIPTDIQAKSWIIADLDTGNVLAARDPHLRNRPASTLKTLTALTLLPKLDQRSRAPFTAQDLQETAQADGKSTRIGLEPGRAYPVNRLFEAMLVASANDAAEALAAAGPGGRQGTLDAMNAQAAHLQADDTHAGTPSGLDATGQYTSAYDMALIARAALATPNFATYDGAKNVSLIGSKGVFGDSNHNRLLNSYTGAYAGKDGFTSLSGWVYWGAASRAGHHLVVVVVGSINTPVTDEIHLLDWGFAAYGKAATVGTLVGPAVPGQPAPGATPAAGATPAITLPTAPAARAAAIRALAAHSVDTGLPHWLLYGAGAVGVLLALVLLARRRRTVAARSPRVPRPRPTPSSGVGPTLSRGRPTAMAPPPSLATGAVKIIKAPVRDDA